MNKQQFIARLGSCLGSISTHERERIIAFYEEIIQDRLEDGEAEEAVVESLGDPQRLAEDMLSEIPQTASISLPESKEFKADTQGLRNVRLHIKNQQLTVKISNDRQIHFHYRQSEGVRYKFGQAGDTLLIEQFEERVPFWRWGEPFSHMKLVLEIPLEYCGDLSVTSKNAAILCSDFTNISHYDFETKNASIRISNISAQSIRMVTTNAKIDLRDLKLTGDIECKSTNAKIQGGNISAGSIDIGTTNGKLSLTDFCIENRLKAVTTNGTIDCQSVAARDMELQTSNGGIRADIAGKQTDYNISCSTTNGKCSLPNQILSESSRKLTAHSSNGNINVHFVV